MSIFKIPSEQRFHVILYSLGAVLAIAVLIQGTPFWRAVVVGALIVLFIKQFRGSKAP